MGVKTLKKTYYSEWISQIRTGKNLVVLTNSLYAFTAFLFITTPHLLVDTNVCLFVVVKVALLG